MPSHGSCIPSPQPQTSSDEIVNAVLHTGRRCKVLQFLVVPAACVEIRGGRSPVLPRREVDVASLSVAKPGGRDRCVPCPPRAAGQGVPPPALIPLRTNTARALRAPRGAVRLDSCAGVRLRRYPQSPRESRPALYRLSRLMTSSRGRRDRQGSWLASARVPLHASVYSAKE